jgi:hypothetical protein
MDASSVMFIPDQPSSLSRQGKKGHHRVATLSLCAFHYVFGKVLGKNERGYGYCFPAAAAQKVNFCNCTALQTDRFYQTVGSVVGKLICRIRENEEYAAGLCCLCGSES